MSLLGTNNTKWALFLGSNSGTPENRHILDLAYGLACLENAGIQPHAINIYIDGKDRKVISSLIDLGSQNKYVIKETNDFFDELKTNTSQNLVVFITGHGNQYGIDASQQITPYNLISSLKNSSNLERAVVYLGQCFAGVFNYVRAGRSDRQDKYDTDIILIGATNLQESISSSTTEYFPAIPQGFTWVANIFLLYVFKWFSSPFDIDGDGIFTIMDSYKYAGVMANSSHLRTKAGTLYKTLNFYSELKEYVDICQNPTGVIQTDMQNKLKLDAIEKQYLSSSNLHNTHQECWILNSIPAQSIKIK